LFSSPLTSRTAALLLLLTAILAGYALIVEPIISGYSETDRQIEEARDQLARFERAAAMRPALVKQMKELNERRTSGGYFLAVSTDALAAAGLQDQVRDLVIEKGGSIRSIQPMPGVASDGLTRITLRVQMAGTIETLLDVLYALETGNPILFVDSLDVQKRDNAQRDNAQAGGDSGAETGTLAIAVDLSGYLPKESK